MRRASRTRDGLARLLAPIVVCGVFLILTSQAPAETRTDVSESSGVSATLTFQASLDELGVEQTSGLMLAIARSGTIYYNQPVQLASCEIEECRPHWEGEHYGGSVHVVVLEPAGEPVVVLDVNTGGAHCCEIVQIFSYAPESGGYTSVARDFGNGSPRLEQLSPGEPAEFVTSDQRFAYAFTDYARSGRPLRILAFSQGAFVDVTRRYPSLIAQDAALEWRYFLSPPHDDTVGFFAAWAADEEMLGHNALVNRVISHELLAGRLRVTIGTEDGEQFVHDLGTALRRWGYIRGGSGIRSTRACGQINQGIGIAARATSNVPCAVARRVLPSVLLGSTRCYPSAGRFHPCTVEGFYCTQRYSRATGVATARCVRGNRLITGTAGP